MIQNKRLALQQLGKRIYQLRRQKRLTQAQLAQACDLTTGQVKRLEKGRYNLRFYSLARIVETLGLQMHELVNLKNS